MKQEIQKPSITKMGKDVAVSILDIVRASALRKPIVVNDQTQQERFAICSSCEYLVQDKCQICGCFMKNKVKIAPAKCPIDKWGIVEEEQTHEI